MKILIELLHFKLWLIKTAYNKLGGLLVEYPYTANCAGVGILWGLGD